jgi:Na+-transporting NADH:ubiquinone oxidoreductase subunit B
MLWGTIPGSIGESSKPLIIIGAVFLAIAGIASWRIMLSMLIGAASMGIILNWWGATPFMEIPWYYQFYMGSFFFAMAFMATDPVTASSTAVGKWIYGFLIGFVGMIVRVMNPAYPEGLDASDFVYECFCTADRSLCGSGQYESTPQTGESNGCLITFCN